MENAVFEAQHSLPVVFTSLNMIKAVTDQAFSLAFLYQVGKGATEIISSEGHSLVLEDGIRRIAISSTFIALYALIHEVVPQELLQNINRLSDIFYQSLENTGPYLYSLPVILGGVAGIYTADDVREKADDKNTTS